MAAQAGLLADMDRVADALYGAGRSGISDRGRAS